MASPKVQAALEALAEALKEELRGEVREEFLGLLGSTPAKTKGKPGPKPKSAAPAAKAGGRRSAEDVEATGKKVLAFVKANPDQRVEQIAKGLGVSTKELKLPIIKLMSRPTKLVTKGVKRGTTYRVKG